MTTAPIQPAMFHSTVTRVIEAPAHLTWQAATAFTGQSWLKGPDKVTWGDGELLLHDGFYGDRRALVTRFESGACFEFSTPDKPTYAGRLDLAPVAGGTQITWQTWDTPARLGERFLAKTLAALFPNKVRSEMESDLNQELDNLGHLVGEQVRRRS